MIRSLRKNQEGAVGPIEILLMLVAVGIIGFTMWRITSTDDNNQQASQEIGETTEAAEAIPTNIETLKTISEIQTAVETDAGDTTVAGIELEFEDGVLVYVVHLSDGTVLAYDATTGIAVVIEDDDDDEFEDGDQLPANFSPSISLGEALEIARGQRPGIDIEKVEIELEHGEIVYSVRFVDDGRVDINTEDGSIVDLRGVDGVRDAAFKDSDNDLDEDGLDNGDDPDDDNDGMDDSDDPDDDNDGLDDDDDDDDDNDGEDDDDDDDHDNSGSSSN